jgi:NADPH-dependent 2,4-dienoyl-CoA reductase/sulfur reductase-like enzyme/rhodanese-related sulfurtransferase
VAIHNVHRVTIIVPKINIFTVQGEFVMTERLIIIGGVAGGATAAARARRLNEKAEIILFERGEYISFANCGLPYYLGNVIKKRKDLLVTTPEDLIKRYRVDVRTFSEVVAIHRDRQEVEVKNIKTGDVYHESYDKIILSPGAEPIKPPLEGIDLTHIFSVRNLTDIDRIKKIVDETKPKSAVVVGGGFIGLEMAENLSKRKVRVTIVEKMDQIMTPVDVEMAAIAQKHLEKKGIVIELGNGVKGFAESGSGLRVITEMGSGLECDLVILAIGVKPENQLADGAGLSLGERGGIRTDEAMVTSDPNIFAVGDAVEVPEYITGKPVMIPLAGPANKQGRIAAENVMGRKTTYRGTMGTSIVDIFGLALACTGLNERIVKQENIQYQKSYTTSGSHASYYPGAEDMTIKLLFSQDDGTVLGAQIAGHRGVDKRIDVIATAIRGKMTVYDLEELELAYAPPFSSAKDPVNVAGFVAANILRGDLETVYWDELEELDRDQHIFVDLRTKDEITEHGSIPGSIHIPTDDLRDRLHELDREKTFVLFCAVGMRGYIAYRILSQNGYKAKSFSGGNAVYRHAVC